MTNLSHVVNSLSFGPPVAPDAIKRLERSANPLQLAYTGTSIPPHTLTPCLPALSNDRACVGGGVEGVVLT
jgi:hypothetical protein